MATVPQQEEGVVIGTCTAKNGSDGYFNLALVISVADE